MSGEEGGGGGRGRGRGEGKRVGTGVKRFMKKLIKSKFGSESSNKALSQ